MGEILVREKRFLNRYYYPNLIIKGIFSLKLINEACLTKGLREKSKNLIDLKKPK